MPHRMQQAVLGIAVLGCVIGLVALSRLMTSSGSLILAPVVLFPYLMLALTSRAAHAPFPQAILLAAALFFAGLSYLSLTPSADAQGGLIVVAVPMLQGAVALFVYVMFRLFGPYHRAPRRHRATRSCAGRDPATRQGTPAVSVDSPSTPFVEDPCPSVLPPNPGMQRTRYARR